MLTDATIVGACSGPNYTSITKSSEYLYTEIVMRPLWLALCTVGNIFNIMLLRKMRTFQSVFFVSIAVFDLSAMWFWFADFVKERFPAQPSPNHSTEAFLVTCQFLADVAALSSHCTLAVFCATRLVCLISPFRFQPLLSKRRMRMAITCIVLGSVPVAIYRVVRFVARDNLSAGKTWLEQWGEVQTIVAILASAIPCVSMIGLNLVVVIILCKRRRRSTTEEGYDIGVANARVFAMHIHRTKGLAVSWHSKDSLMSTAMRLLTANVVIWCAFAAVFWITRIVNWLHDACRLHLSDQQHVALHIVDVNFQYGFYSINFLVYCGVSRVYFRRCVRLVVRCLGGCSKEKVTRSKEPSTQDTILV